jgi:cell wall-associated NlpC family hydrolase
VSAAAGPATTVAATAPLRAAPEPGAEQVDQLLFGEGFDVLRTQGDWAYGQAMRDGYPGWLERSALKAGAPAPTHRVAVLRTFAFADPHFKAPVGRALSLNALVCIEAEKDGFAHGRDAGWIAAQHLAPLGTFEADPAAVAERHLGVPYLWGGRDSIGLDCSGLVQQALYACGRACPRNSDQQAAIGEPVAPHALGRSDLVFWRGHVGMMLDPRRILHANVHHMAVAVEPLDETVSRRLANGEGPPTGFRRLASR